MKQKLLFILMLLLPMSSMAKKVAYAVLQDGTLTFYYGKKKPAGAYDVGKIIIRGRYDYKEWSGARHEIKTVVFDKSFKDYRPKNCYKWFDNCENLTSVIGIKENLNTENVTSMSSMFRGCKNLTSLDVSGFNTENVTNMSSMFRGCNNLISIDVSGFNTENVTNMSGMFFACKSLTNIDVSGFNTENVIDMDGMFGECSGLTSLDLSNFNTENVIDIGAMFGLCNFLKTIYVGNGWNMSKVTISAFIFSNCTSLVGGNGTRCDGLQRFIDVSFARIDGGESAPGYLTKKE